MKNKNNQGFTLVELLATLAVLSLVMTITTYVALNVVNKTKNKSYEVTINNIESSAGSYLKENSEKLFFITIADSGNEYQCIQIKDLIDMGYFKNNITSSKISNDRKVLEKDYIYLSRNKDTKVLTSSQYVMKETLENVCSKSVNATTDISFSVSPSGWAKEKNVTINYRVKNILDTSNYKNYYYYINKGESTPSLNGSDVTSPATFKVTKNGEVTAYINDEDTAKKLTITKIDNVGPTVSVSYSGNNTVKSSVTIAIKIKDVGIGVDESSVSVDDFKVYVGTTEITEADNSDPKTPSKKLTHKSGDDYELVINNNTLNGPLSITVYDDTIFDKLGKPNKTKTG